MKTNNNNHSTTRSSAPIACEDSAVFVKKTDRKRLGLRLPATSVAAKLEQNNKGFRVLF